jgi:hypothetical protein
MNNKPVHEIRLGAVKAAVWANNSASGTWHSVSFGRLYKADDGAWKTSDSFGRDDLPLVEKVADLAHRWIYTNSKIDAPTE